MLQTSVIVHNHPLLYLRAFTTSWPQPLEDIVDLTVVRKYFSQDQQHPLSSQKYTKSTVRDLLRYGGFKPSGRNKPAWEYLEKAISKEWFAPHKGINAAVDSCNAVSLHSKLPVSVLDLDKCIPPYCIKICPEHTSYPFNPSGQILKADGLIALFDAYGPCGTPVKDAQRTKTEPTTQKTLSIIWGHIDLASYVDEATEWYLSLLAQMSCTTSAAQLIHKREE